MKKRLLQIKTKALKILKTKKRVKVPQIKYQKIRKKQKAILQTQIRAKSQINLQNQKINQRLKKTKHKILVQKM